MTDPLNVLLIDDSIDDRMAVQRMLKKHPGGGMKITECETGKDGLQALSAGTYDCVLLDYSMPGADGIHILKEIKLQKPDQPILMLTGEDNVRLAVAALKYGAQDYLLKSDITTNGTLVTAIEDAISHKQDQLAFIDQHLRDELTGLYLRRPYFEHLDQALQTANRSGKRVGVLFIDLNGMKTVNDTYGHAAGDFVLVDIANKLKTCVREVDRIGRFGGDEFVITLSELDTDPMDSCIRVCERIITHVTDNPCSYEGQTLALSLSVGIAVSEENDLNSKNLVLLADQSMYTAKKSRSHSACLYPDKLIFERVSG